MRSGGRLRAWLEAAGPLWGFAGRAKAVGYPRCDIGKVPVFMNAILWIPAATDAALCLFVC